MFRGIPARHGPGSQCKHHAHTRTQTIPAGKPDPCIHREYGVEYDMSDASMEKVDLHLENISGKLDVIIDIMQKPENRFIRVLEIAGTIITVVSLLSVIDTLWHWLAL